MISFEKKLFKPVDDNGRVKVIQDGTQVKVFKDVFTEELYIEYYGKHYTCVCTGTRTARNNQFTINDQKDLQELLESGRSDADLRRLV